MEFYFLFILYIKNYYIRMMTNNQTLFVRNNCYEISQCSTFLSKFFSLDLELFMDYAEANIVLMQ